MEQEKKELYKVFWSGEDISVDYLSEYYKIELDRIKHDNKLLGEFNSNGKYSFNPEVKKGLIAIKKKIEDKKDNSYLLIAKTMQNLFSFKLRIFEVEGQKDLLAANLYLIEIADDERMEKSLITFVAQYVDHNNDEFLNKVKYIFNISIDGEFLEHEKKDNEEIILPYVPAKKMSEITEEQIDKNYVEKMLEELDKCGEIGKSILKVFKEKVKTDKEEQKISFSVQRKILNAIIEKHKAMPILIQNTNIIEIIKVYNKQIDNILKKENNIEQTINDKKEEKKEEKPKEATASKPAAKKAGGGGKESKVAKAKPNKIPPSKKEEKKKKKDKKDPPYKGAVAIKKKEIEIPKIGLNVVQKDQTKKIPKVVTTLKQPKQPTILKPSKKESPKPIQKQEEQEDVLSMEDFAKEWGESISVFKEEAADVLFFEEIKEFEIKEKAIDLIQKEKVEIVASVDIKIPNTDEKDKKKNFPNLEKNL